MKTLSKFFIIFGIILLFITIYSFILSINKNQITPIYEDENIISNELSNNKNYIKEEFSIEIASIDTLENFKQVINNEINEKNLSGIDIPILIDDYVRKKFKHGTPTYYWFDNWFLGLLDLILPNYHFLTLMKPKDLIKVHYAMCSQQSIIFQEIIKDYNFEFGSLKINNMNFGHFVSAVKINDKWYIFDPNMEPVYNRKNPEIFNDIMSGNLSTLKKIYSKTNLNYILKNLSEKDFNKDMVSLVDINKFPARNGVMVQNLSKLISYLGWMFSFLIGFIFIYLLKKE